MLDLFHASFADDKHISNRYLIRRLDLPLAVEQQADLDCLLLPMAVNPTRFVQQTLLNVECEIRLRTFDTQVREDLFQKPMSPLTAADPVVASRMRCFPGMARRNRSQAGSDKNSFD